MNHAVHIHDLLTWLGGPIVELNALAATRVNDVETEDCAVAVGRTDDGALVTMNVTTGAALESSRLTWCFEHVTIESSTDPYHPARGPWRFDFRDTRTAEAAGPAGRGSPTVPSSTPDSSRRSSTGSTAAISRSTWPTHAPRWSRHRVVPLARAPARPRRSPSGRTIPATDRGSLRAEPRPSRRSVAPGAARSQSAAVAAAS